MVRAGLTRAWLLVAALFAGSCVTPPPPAPEVPVVASPPREFRAAWVAAVGNIDWPSRRDLTVAQQQAELIRIVDRAKEIGLNALIVQVRPATDALYQSTIEPWSEYLTGTQGKAPQPFFDPLAMWITEAHRRGIELHAWFNPYRARHTTSKSAMASHHVSRTMPGAVKTYGAQMWMDPGEPESARRTLEVIVDVTRRYDVDGIHIDDYFYPYPEKALDGSELDFPDDRSWAGYMLAGGWLTRADWRRANVDRLVEAIHVAVHREKPWVKFGVSPFGVGRPELRPAGVEGFSQYDRIYANVELWLARGWLDYLAPQLYWPVDSAGQPFTPLLDSWMRANTAHRHVWPGYFTSRIEDGTPNSFSVDEIPRQVAITRARGVDGHIHFSMTALMQNRHGIADRLKALYAVPAQVPETPWLPSRPERMNVK